MINQWIHPIIPPTTIIIGAGKLKNNTNTNVIPIKEEYKFDSLKEVDIPCG